MSIHFAATPEDCPGNVVRILSKQEEHEAEMTDHVVALLNSAMLFTPARQGPGSVMKCHMCYELDDQHTNLCPVPQLEDWLAARR